MFTPLPPGWERFENERYVLNLGSWEGLTFVQRLRLAKDEVEETVDEIRGRVADRNHYSTAWWVDDRATPSDLTERLVALGLCPAEERRLEPHGTGLALLAEPPAVAGITAREVETLEEWRQAAEVGNEVFEVPVADREAQRRTAEKRFQEQREPAAGQGLRSSSTPAGCRGPSSSASDSSRSPSSTS